MIQLPEAEALDRLESMVQHSEEPTLTGGELADLLRLAVRADSDGREPADADWLPTWDLNAASAEGWRRKAGKVVARFDVTTDGATLRRAQMFAHCLTMAETYARKVAASVAPHGTSAASPLDELLA